MKIVINGQTHKLHRKQDHFHIKCNYVSKIIGQLEKEDSTTLTEQSEILKATENFYKNLYENKDGKIEKNDIEQYMKANKMEGMLTKKEISDILYNMEHDKSPGLSGFSAEFFKVFLETLRVFVLRSLNLGYKNGELSITQKARNYYMYPKGK